MCDYPNTKDMSYNSTTATPVTVTGTPVVVATTTSQAIPQQRVLVQETILITVDDPNDKPAAGKVYIRACGLVIGLFAFAELVASSLAIHNSSGYYIGGIYVSIMAMLYSFFILSPTGIRTQADVGWRLLLTWLNWIVCVIGLAITSAQYSFVNSLEACATYSSSLSTSCNTAIGIQAVCNGNSDYYFDAAACEANYATDNDFSIEDNECSCVSSSYDSTDDDSGCYSFENMNSCSNFLNNTPHQLATCISFLVLMLIVYVLLIVFLSLSRYNPKVVQTQAEREEEEQFNAQNPRGGSNLNASLLNQQYVSSSSAPVVYVTSA